MTHGTRACYQAGCKALPCRAANAAYIAHLRDLHRQGKQPLGTLISPLVARQQIASLKAEHVPGRQLTRLCGLQSHAFVVSAAISLRKALTLRRIYRAYMQGGEPE